MAYNQEFTKTVQLRYSLYGEGEATGSRVSTEGFQFHPDKVAGGFIEFADGSKFRRATAYARCQTSIQRGAPQHTDSLNKEAPWFNKHAYIRSDPGGGDIDNVYQLNFAHAGAWAGINDIRSPVQEPSGQQANEAITKALLDLADNKANIGENLATFQQTLRLMTNPVGQLTKALRSIHNNRSFRPLLQLSYQDMVKGRFVGKATKEVAEKYLQYVYGLRPLMQDIYGSVELAKGLGKTPLLLRADGKSTRNPTTSGQAFYNPSFDSETRIVQGQAIDLYRCTLWGRVDPEYGGTRALNQLGLLNPASLAWELVPWSFVIDWVLPIGPVLQALTAPAGLIFVDGSISRKVSVVMNLENEWQKLFPGSTRFPGFELINHSPATGTLTYKSYRRVPLGGWPQAGLWFDMDPLRGDRSLKALALSVMSLRSLR